MRKIVVISAGLSTPSSTRLLADQISDSVRRQITARGEAVDFTFVELRDLAGDLAQAMQTGAMPNQKLDEVKNALSEADALVAVSPVFAASYSGLFKMFFDVLDPDALTGMPTLIAATAGTPRHSLVLDYAMRPLLTYFRANVVPTGVFAATEDFGGAEGKYLEGRIQRAATELSSLVVSESGAVEGFTAAETTAPRRTSGTSIDTGFTPFESLLKGHSGD